MCEKYKCKMSSIYISNIYMQNYLVRHEKHICINRKAWFMQVDIKTTWRPTVRWRNSCDPWKIKPRFVIRENYIYMNMNLPICVVKIEDLPYNELVVNLPYRIFSSAPIFHNLLSASLLYSPFIVSQRPDTRAWHYPLRYVITLQN